MDPHPTTGVARFPKARQLTAIDKKGASLNLQVQQIAIVSESGDWVEVRVIAGTGMPKLYTIKRLEAYDFMRNGVAEPQFDLETNVICEYKSWPIPGPYGTGDAPHPWDVVQGGQGDCRIISGLQVLALCQPKLLMNALTFDASAGTCTIRLRRTPSPKEVARTNAPFEAFTFSTALPCKFGPGTNLIYCGADTDVTHLPLWPCFFEKALACMWGGYGALKGAEERSLMSALGIHDVNSIHFDQSSKDGVQDTEGWAKTIKDAFATNCPMTTYIMGKQHNYGIVGVTAHGVLVCDPNSRQTGDYFQRWNGGHRIFNGDPATLKDSVNFPMFLTWDQYFTNFMWVHIFHV